MRNFIYLTLIIGLILSLPAKTMAISDPRLVTNNKMGVHVLDPSEIKEAAELINGGENGAWGYLTVPIQSNDRNRNKWSEFMKRCRELRVIPIIRVATVPEGSNWIIPNNFDLIDFANFLNELDWPTTNRYVIIFNEVNHGNEYGGLVSPEHYAQILVNAINIFKERNENFFILPSAMDNATISTGVSIYWKEYLLRMYRERPDVFNLIDGWNSHAYPSPAFSGRVTDRTDKSIRSFESDLRFIQGLGAREIPIFITETGWDISNLGEDKVANNFDRAFAEVWNQKNIIAVTPFLLRAGEGPFVKFSLIRKDGTKTKVYETLKGLAKIKGEPEISGEQKKVNISVIENKDSLESNSDWFKLSLSSWKKIWSELMIWLTK